MLLFVLGLSARECIFACLHAPICSTRMYMYALLFPHALGNPSLIIQTAPVGVTRERNVKIWFDLSETFSGSSSAASTIYTCQLNGNSVPSNCSSPWSRDMMEEGTHTLVIASADSNVSSASYSWTIGRLHEISSPKLVHVVHLLHGHRIRFILLKLNVSTV